LKNLIKSNFQDSIFKIFKSYIEVKKRNIYKIQLSQNSCLVLLKRLFKSRYPMFVTTRLLPACDIFIFR